MDNESIRNNVVEILRKYPETRNNDNLLIIRFILKLGYARKKIDKITIDLLKFECLPSFESITRVRRDIQNKDKLYLPDKETIEKRTKSEREYKERYSRSTIYDSNCGINKNSQYL
jgi:hypothetical protein